MTVIIKSIIILCISSLYHTNASSFWPSNHSYSCCRAERERESGVWKDPSAELSGPQWSQHSDVVSRSSAAQYQIFNLHHPQPLPPPHWAKHRGTLADRKLQLHSSRDAQCIYRQQVPQTLFNCTYDVCNGMFGPKCVYLSYYHLT